ncbi:MAG: gamma-glutamyltransferase [Dongiaceae bacterium]
MRDFHKPGRSVVYSTEAMAATSHPLATAAALEVLRTGGNAMDAAIAAVAVQSVVEPHMTGIGGDCFVLYAPKGGNKIVAFDGAGRAPMAASAEKLVATGATEIDPRSPHAVTVPCAIDGWVRLNQDHGKKPLAELLAPAIRYAEHGYPVSDRVAVDWALEVDHLSHDAGAKALFLPNGLPPAAGAIHRQPALAETLKRIAREGRDGFYKGPVAADMVDRLKKGGGAHTLDDFADAAGRYVEPISSDYRGYRVHECPPPGQGIAALGMMNILSGYELGRLDPVGAERVHLETEATRLAMRDRDAFLADPDHTKIDVKAWLSPAHAEACRRQIDPGRAMQMPPSAGFPNHRDTVYLTVVDRDRNAVSFINSIFWGFGSGMLAAKSGVVLHNRGSSFSLADGHPNRLAPGKRPLHTIIPAMVTKDGQTVMPFGVMGGHYQPVGQAHVLTNIVDFGMDPQAALDCPRSFYEKGALHLESGFPAETARKLTAMGHKLEDAPEPYGGGQAIWIDAKRGLLLGASDQRKDGLALGY